MTPRDRYARALVLLGLGLLLAGCATDHAQSMLHPASDEAREISRLWWVMLGVYGAVTLVTFGLLGAGLLARRAAAAGPPGGDVRFVVIAGVVVPSVVLVGVLLYSLRVSRALHRPEGAFRIEVTGRQWWWDVRYPDHGLVTANELVLPAGRAVTIDLRSADVIHSFWVPNLHGKMDALPGHPNRFWLRASTPGVYRGQCAEFCGVQHALMALDVVALEGAEFERWVAARRAGPAAPADDEARRGREVFFAAGCDACHAVAGTPAVAGIGPDLTFVGARRTLGAGTVPNTRGDLAGWISHPQTIKPGNFMPPTYLAPADLHALVRYLEGLR